MSNIPCEVVRDLIPLALDQVCSAKSGKIVAEHVAGCPDCQKVMEEAQAALPVAPVSPPAEITFAAAFRQMVKAIRRKYVLWALAGMVAAVLLITGGEAAYDRFLVRTDTPIPLSRIELSLSQTSQGYVVENVSMQEGYKYYGYYRSWNPHTGLIYIQPVKPALEWLKNHGTTTPGQAYYASDLRVKDGILYRGEEESTQKGEVWRAYAHPVREIRLGTEEAYKVLYQAGDDIPLCPEKTEQALPEHPYEDGKLMDRGG